MPNGVLSMLKLFQDSYDYYDRYDDNRDLFERRYSGMGNSNGMRGAGGNSGRDFMPMGRREPMPLPPTLGAGSVRGNPNNSMRGMSANSGSGGGYDTVFSRRSPPRGNGMGRFR